MSELVHVCRAVSPKCYAILWSYGEICVGCGCCQKNREARRKARLKYHREFLKEKKAFKFDEDPEIAKIQRKNNASWVRWHERRIRELTKNGKSKDGS
jgi:hypothetical protein